ATNIANYKITNVTSGGTLTITKAVLNKGTNVMLTTSAPRVDGANYLLIVNNVQDISAQHYPITPNSAIPISFTATLVGMEQPGWAFFQPLPGLDDPNPGANWNQLDFQVPDIWGTGAAGLFVYDPLGNDLPAGKN